MAHLTRIKTASKNFSLPDASVHIAPGFRITFQTGTTAKPSLTTVEVTGPAEQVWTGRDATTTYPGRIVEASAD